MRSPPLKAKREQFRGYYPADILARSIRPFCGTLIARVRVWDSQSGCFRSGVEFQRTTRAGGVSQQNPTLSYQRSTDSAARVRSGAAWTVYLPTHLHHRETQATQQSAADNDEERKCRSCGSNLLPERVWGWVALRRREEHTTRAERFVGTTGDAGWVSLLACMYLLSGDSQVDYYLVKDAVVTIHMSELLQHFFAKLRPSMPLRNRTQAARNARELQPAACVISLQFRSLNGAQLQRYDLPATLVIEQQHIPSNDSAESGSSASAAATGTEHFDIITCKALVRPGAPPPAMTVGELLSSPKHKPKQLPTEPGYVWLRIWDRESSRVYFHSAMLHQGASTRLGAPATLHARWLPGVLESFPTLDSRQRRCLKGQLTVVASAPDDEPEQVVVVAQHLPAARLERYAATIESYARTEEQAATQ
ncbi:hypothetical protein FI667_g10484, partial [Globisporangium splendens]